IDYARCLLDETVLGRFRSLEETFTRSDIDTNDLSLNPDEAFILSRAEETALSAGDLVNVSAMTEAQALHAIYTLWAGGLLIRKKWRPAFAPNQIAAMKGARLELKREAKRAGVPEVTIDETTRPKPEIKASAKEPEITITVEEYLAQVEKAETFY